MPEVLTKTESGIKWWLRYVIIPLIGSGGLLGAYMAGQQLIMPKPAEAAPVVTASVPAGTVETLPTPVFTSTPIAWPPGDQVSSDRHSRCEVAPAGLEDPGREKAVIVQFKISGRDGYCTWITPLNGFNAEALKQVSFWVKGREGGEAYTLALRDSRMPEDSAPEISRTASDRWDQVVIPLDRFSGLDTASLGELSLTVRAGSSAIYVDRIEFLP